MENKKNIDGVTGLRGCVALWVMLFHSYGIILPLMHLKPPTYIWGFNITPIYWGSVGVDIFFALTGFLLFLPFAGKLISPQKEISLRHYFKRRILRIFPAYYAQIIILAVLATYGLSDKVSLSNWLAHIFLVHNFSVIWNWSINGVWWTLPTEFLFYLMLPLLFLLIRRIGFPLFITAAITIAIVYKLALFPFISHENINYKNWLFGQLPGRIDLFAYGMLAAFLYQKYRNGFLLRQFSWVITLAGISGIWLLLLWMGRIAGVFWEGHYSLYIWYSICGFAIFLLILGTATDNKLARILFAHKLAMHLGTISYGIYLWHVPMLKILFVDHHFAGYIDNIWILTAIFIISTYTIALASYHFIEKPFMDGTVERMFNYRGTKLRQLSFRGAINSNSIYRYDNVAVVKVKR